jgi:DNA helicase-2/ATP-dependent DNA helicase PcrA
MVRNYGLEDGEGKAVKIVYCWNDKEEARFVVSEIQMRLKAGVIQPSDIAILVRAGFQTRMFEEALISLAIPYKIIGGFKFYERAEIRDAISYIRASINHGDNIALERIINTPKRSVGASTIAAIKSYANQNNISTFAAIKQMIEHNLFKPRIHSSLEFLINKLEEWNNVYSIMNLYESTKKILEESGYMAMLKEENTDEANARMENLREMLRAMNDFQTIEAFLEHASLVTDGDLKGAVENAISLMTVHAAKGLEFDLVFLPGFEDGLFPHQKSIADDGPKGLEEERRLAYVGITRAKNELYISYAQSRRIYNEFVASIPSRFIEEILGDGVEKIASSVHYSKKVTIPSPAPQASNNTKATGIYVNHSIFGKGVIIRRDGDSVEVAFADHGIKKLKEQYLVPCD